MLLDRIHIGRYRGLSDLTFEDLGAVSLIVGPNNSGKSSILEAISLMLRPLDPTTWIQAARHSDSDADLADAIWSTFPDSKVLQLGGGPSLTEPTILGGSIDHHYRDTIVSAVANESWNSGEFEGPELDLTVIVDEKQYGIGLQRRGRRFAFRRYNPKLKTLEPEPPVHYRCLTITPSTHRSGSTLVEHLSHVIDSGQKTLAIELLQLFDPQVKSIDVSAARHKPTIVVQHGARGAVDLASFGDGMRRAVTLALALSRASGGVLLIDELETGIHPGILTQVIQRLLDAATTANVQIVATTHSLEAVDAVVAAAAHRPDTLTAYHLFAADRAQNVRRYGHARLQKLRAAGLDLR